MTFEEWMQARLTVHGYPVSVDGALGGETRRALIAFQQKKKLKQSGVADQATIGALRMEPDSKIAVTVPQERMPPWMSELHRRMGLHETRDKGVLSAFLKLGKFLGDPAKLPWCGDAIESSIVKTLPFEPVPNNPFWAQAWASFGVDAKGPKVGSIGVIKWSASAGHVGTVAAYDAKRQRVLLLGGNQSNAITLAWFPLAKFIAFRWPKTFEMRDYPALTGGADGDMAGTR